MHSRFFRRRTRLQEYCQCILYIASVGGPSLVSCEAAGILLLSLGILPALYVPYRGPFRRRCKPLLLQYPYSLQGNRNISAFLATSANLIKQAVLLQGFMAGKADNSFYMFKVGLQLYRVVPLPDRGFLMDKMIFANPSPTYNTNSNSIRIFAFYGALITFHRFSS